MTESRNRRQGKAGVSLWRRLAAIFYDSLVLVCLVFIAWLPVPLVPDDQWPQWLSRGWRLAYLGCVVYAFYGWFWVHGGQTLGMRAWRLRLVDAASRPDAYLPVGWKQALLRLAVAWMSWAALGLGFLWSLWDPERRTWHDIASRSRLEMAHRLR
ncbi:MAG: RDD family protein [Gammaproteobacteria bacterium]|nr:RDD family protein [Gammaproteobacteria bacterium]MXY64536.1 RDD family protein [Gammaproteobacteria bacterium]MYG65889.1 RDD family protein [Gammaproteobacteria bacterium]MYH90743.1 RDD family protein [Gammaproteobacteria bacterium]